MVLWFKKVWQKLFPAKPQRALSYNRAQLCREMENLSNVLYDFRSETSLKILVEVIELAKNVQILDVTRYHTEKEILIHQGRIAALNDLSQYISSAIAAKQTEAKRGKKDAVRGALHVRGAKRTGNQAGAAI